MEFSAAEIADEYDHLDDSLEYVLENVLCGETPADGFEFKSLQEDYNSFLMNICKCGPEDDCTDCAHGGNYIFDSNCSLELVLNEAIHTDLKYECSTLCKCNRNKCLNRLVQYGPRKHLKIIDSDMCGSKGLITTKDIPKGAFICEYAGELITRTEARRRCAENERHHKMNYILCLNEIKIDDETGNRKFICVDPSCRGNIGRYLNHHCTPNCEVYSVRIDCPVPKIAIFAKRPISSGEELCFHYNGGIVLKDGSKKPVHLETNLATPCLCRSEKCEKYLPSLDF